MHIVKNDGIGNLTFVLTNELELGVSCWLGFIEELKSEIPTSGRSYNPKTFEWIIEKEYWDIFYHLRKKYFIGENQEELAL